jgi:hypothetical protein
MKKVKKLLKKLFKKKLVNNIIKFDNKFECIDLIPSPGFSNAYFHTNNIVDLIKLDILKLKYLKINDRNK